MVLISTPTFSSGWKIKAGSSARRVVGFSLNVRLSLFNLHCSSSFFIYLKARAGDPGAFADRLVPLLVSVTCSGGFVNISLPLLWFSTVAYESGSRFELDHVRKCPMFHWEVLNDCWELL